MHEKNIFNVKEWESAVRNLKTQKSELSPTLYMKRMRKLLDIKMKYNITQSESSTDDSYKTTQLVISTI